MLCKNYYEELHLAIKPLPDNEIFAFSKLRAFADENFIVTQNIKFVSPRVGNFVEKGENRSHQHFLLFQQCFKGAFTPGGLLVSKGLIVYM